MPGRKFKLGNGTTKGPVAKSITAAGHKYGGRGMKQRKGIRGESRDPVCWCGQKHSESPTTRETPELFERIKTRKEMER